MQWNYVTTNRLTWPTVLYNRFLHECSISHKIFFFLLFRSIIIISYEEINIIIIISHEEIIAIPSLPMFSIVIPLAVFLSWGCPGASYPKISRSLEDARFGLKRFNRSKIFDRHLGSTAVKLQSATAIVASNRAASRLHEIWWWDVLTNICTIDCYQTRPNCEQFQEQFLRKYENNKKLDFIQEHFKLCFKSVTCINFTCSDFSVATSAWCVKINIYSYMTVL